MARTCPDGHLSTAADYCDVCGLAITSSDEADATSPDLEPVPPAAQECPNCSAQNPPDALFCEACGYDYTTGTMPRPVEPLAFPLPASLADPGRRMPSEAQVHSGGSEVDVPDAGAAAEDAPVETESAEDAPVETEAAEGTAASGDTGGDVAAGGVPDSGSAAHAPSPATAPRREEPAGVGANPSPGLTEPWVAEVWIDPDWYADQGSSDRMPSPGLPTIVLLQHTSSLIRRASRSRGIAPEVDVSADPGVSRRHAQLTTDGRRWFVEDLGSANGTYVGAATADLPSTPLAGSTKHEIGPDEQIYLGAWTRIVVRKAAEGEV